MEHVEHYTQEEKCISIKDEMRKVCRDYFVAKWSLFFSFDEDLNYDFEQWEDLCLLNYLRAYFRDIPRPRYIYGDRKRLKKILKEKLVRFDEVIRNSEVLSDSSICKIKSSLKNFFGMRNKKERNEYEERATYETMTDQLMKFCLRTGQRIYESDVTLEIKINERLLVPLIIITIIYEEYMMCSNNQEFLNMGAEIQNQYYSTRRVQECRMSNTINFTLKCMAELLYYNIDVVNELATCGLDISAEAGNCLCEVTEYYTTMLMEKSESELISALTDETEPDEEEEKEFAEVGELGLQAIADFVVNIDYRRMVDNITPIQTDTGVIYPTGKKDDPNRKYEKLIRNGFKREKGCYRFTDDIKPLLNRLLKYLKKDKDSISSLFSRYSTEQEWNRILKEEVCQNGTRDCSYSTKLFMIICLVEFGLQFGGTMEQPLYNLSVERLLFWFRYFYSLEEAPWENAKKLNLGIFLSMCEKLPAFQKELQEPSKAEIDKIFSKYFGNNGVINKNILTEIYFDKP